MSIYRQAFAWIQQNPGTGGARRLAMLVLSLYNPDRCPYSFAECVQGLDAQRTEMALTLCLEYAKFGETKDLVEVGYALATDSHSSYWELGMAMFTARAEVTARWRREAEAADADSD
jgi:hypothetical protein